MPRFTQPPKTPTLPTDAAIARNAKREKARERAAKKAAEDEPPPPPAFPPAGHL